MAKFSNKEYDNLRKGGEILRGAFGAVEKSLHAGITTLDLDRVAENYIVSHGGAPAFKNYQGYAHTICASINEESVHGIPNAKKILREGDIASIDCGVRYPKTGKDSMCTDAARTFAVGKITDAAQKLIDVTKGSFDVAVDGLTAGQHVHIIGQKISKYIGGKYGIVHTYYGHGIGHNIHDEPLIPNYDIERSNASKRSKQLSNYVLQSGDVICIEPMINAGSAELKTAPDGWTAITVDGSLACHYENTLIVHDDGVEIVT